MFKVYLDGVYHSTHETFTGACRYARTQANSNKQAYFTVFEAGDSSEQLLLDAEQEVMKGVPAYIITPHGAIQKTAQVTQVTERRRAGIANVAAASRYAAGMSRACKKNNAIKIRAKRILFIR
ncbi:MAG: hypothetical protein BWK73_49470 [Thiothrix lacustris]|uniref:Uncharacterized protein n=1 Tax=Thiothrix lacustris TaxID=525917 RepID=A0A1Y1Q8V6_9GAMM|nr:MAG: hypothetical protein BWK73_49470 [Thiothrix lacustris]